MLAYSPDAEPARAYLLRRYNDIDIYVEDLSAQNVYVKLFQRILEGRAVINHVYPLGDRSKVLEACARDQANRMRRRLYIIDADQDLIHDRPAPALLHLYRLGVYSSENLLLSERAALNIAMEGDTNVGFHDLAIRLRFRELMEESCRILTPLFIMYALSEQHALGIPTTKVPVQRFFTQENAPRTLSTSLVRAKCVEIRTLLVARIGIERYKIDRNILVHRILQSGGDGSEYISGKTYLLPILHKHLSRHASFRGAVDTLKVRLAAICELTIDPGLSPALTAAAT